MFKVIRLDGMVLIIPKSFVEELRSLPEHILSPRHLQVYVRFPQLSFVFQVPTTRRVNLI